jgi:16S rRNA processing protein RimM
MARFGELVLVGVVVRPQGRRGEVVVKPLSDRAGRFPTLRRAFLPAPDGEARPVRVESSWPHKGRYVLKLEGTDSIEAAEQLRGLELRIPEQELEALPEGSYYHYQLTGLQVVDGAGQALGVVEGLMETGASAPVLVVRGPAGETLLPFAAEWVRCVDLARRLMVVERPEYVVAD